MVAAMNFWAAPAIAQLEEVIVTAQKRAESVQAAVGLQDTEITNAGPTDLDDQGHELPFAFSGTAYCVANEAVAFYGLQGTIQF